MASVAIERISIHDLDFYYGKTQALKSISLPVYDRTVTAFIGPSGCGKSTLLRVLNRMYDLYPDQHAEGEVLFNGENILARKWISICCVPASAWYPEADAIPDGDLREHRLRRPPRGSCRVEIGERVKSALRQAALWPEVKDKLNSSGLSLSGGQQQRLCIARTVALQPNVILLDGRPPPSIPSGPPRWRRPSTSCAGLTITIVTHNMQQAGRVSQYVAFMYLGELVEFGRTEQIFTAPCDERTQNYVTGRFG